MRPKLLLVIGFVSLLAGCNRVSTWQPELAASDAEPEVVVLIHAIWRWPGYSMRRLWNEGIHRGYEVVYFRYSGLMGSLDTNADRLARLLERYPGRRIHMVAHSYGGLIARRMFGRHEPGGLRRLVMIGTPNQGAAFADRWRHTLIYHLIFGQGGEHLGSEGVEGLAEPDCEYGIIAGTGSHINPWPRGDNDGVVGASEAYLPGAREFRTVRSGHEALPNRPEVARAAYDFLETGSFGLDPAPAGH